MELKGSLRFRLVLLVLLAVVPALGLIIYTASEQRRLAAAEVQEKALLLARFTSIQVEAARQLLIGLAQLPEVRQQEPRACSTLFANILKEYPLYANLGAIRLDGVLFCSALPAYSRINLRRSAYFQQAVKKRDFAISGYQLSRITGKATINFAYPVFDDKGALKAVVFATLDPVWLNQLMSEAQLPEGSELILVDRNGRILIRYPDPKGWDLNSLSKASIIKTILAHGKGVTEALGFDSIPRLYGFTPLLGTRAAGDTYVSIGIPKKAVFAQANRILTLNLVGLGLIGVLAFVAAWVGGDLFILRQVNALVDATKRLSSGDLRARTGLPHGRGELGELARAFDEMAVSLEQRTVELERANRVKAEFLNVVSHELRTPLTAIIGYTGIVCDSTFGGINQAQENALRRTLRCAQELLAMITSILEATKIESGQVQVESHEIKLGNFLDEFRSAYRNPFDKELILRWDYPPGLPMIKIDSEKLRQILGNLIDNAIKFTEKGHVTISARCLSEAKLLEFQVADTGVGIPKEAQPDIFGMFRQLDGSATRVHGGVGLGLHIVKTFTEMLGGKVDVESEQGNGSIFTVTIPFSPVSGPPHG